MSAVLPIARVTVHRDGALVERTGKVAAQDGRAVVTQLPWLLDESSLRVEIEGARLAGVSLGLDVLGEERGDEDAVRAALEAAEQALERLRMRRETTEAQREALEALEPAEPPEEPERTPDATRLRAWVALQGAVDTWAAAIDDRLRALAREIEEAEEVVRRRRQDVERASTEGAWRRWRPTRRAVLRVEGDGELAVTLSYRVPGATWTPAYALHADGLLRSGRWVTRALVAQATGEDWNGVALALSTAPSRRATTLPELKALRLGTPQPEPPAWRELPPDLESLFPADLASAAPEPRPLREKALAPPKKKRAERRREAAADQPAPPPAAVSVASGAAAPVPALRPQAAGEPPRGGAFAGPVDAMEEMAVAGFAAPEPHAAAPEAPGGLEVGAAALDYPRLRLPGWDAPAGVRGRLRAGSPDDLAAEAGVPEGARGALSEHERAVKARARAVTSQPLPPSHVLPGPIEGADFRYEAHDAVDVTSDGHFHSVGVFEAPVTLEVRYRTVPRLDPRAFRTVTARLAESVPMLAGPLDVFIDGSLELSRPWDGSAKGADLVLGLGPEDRLRVARNVRYREESAGLFRGDRRLHTEIEVKIASGLARAAEVEVLERMPVTTADGVEVGLVESQPAAAPYKGEPDGPVLAGGLRQVLDIPPGGELTASVHYAVTLSAKAELEGGDRRG